MKKFRSRKISSFAIISDRSF